MDSGRGSLKHECDVVWLGGMLWEKGGGGDELQHEQNV